VAQPGWTPPVAGTTPPPDGRAWAWGICWLMFASTVLNYMDRQTVALVGPQIKSEFRLSSTDFGWVLLAFQLSYALFQVPAGYLVDRWNVRWAYAGAVAWWSLAGMLAAFAPSLAVLMALRALLGLGESFNWPCALRTTAIVLPPADRSLGNGIFNSGAAVGAVVTPLVVPLLTVRFGWRTAFVVTGVLGFAWVAAWLAFLGGERGRMFSGRRRSTRGPMTTSAGRPPASRRRPGSPSWGSRRRPSPSPCRRRGWAGRPSGGASRSSWSGRSWPPGSSPCRP
jgi:ACS family hexuronate transporter-like MFS transporter